MMREEELRRGRFRPGLIIQLAHGQRWNIPVDSESFGIGSDYESLLDGLDLSESDEELRQAELALLIFLLDFNYDLTADDLASILIESDDFALAQILQATSRKVAELHLSHRRAVSGSAANPGRPWAKLSRFRILCPLK